MMEDFKYGNISDSGSVSKVNEDYYGCFDTPNGKVFVLCDGLSNPIGGHVASKVAVEAIRDYYNAAAYNNIIISLNNALVHANNAVRKKIQEEPELNGMATTCLIAIIKENKVYYADIGDSKLYHFRGGKCTLISGGRAQTTSEIDTTENASGLGLNNSTEPNICNEPLLPEGDDMLLMCSAGLPALILENFGLPIIYKQNQDLQMRVADLIKLADKNGTADNITLQLIEFEPGNGKIKNVPLSLDNRAAIVEKHVKTESFRPPVVLPIILVLLIAAVIYFGFNYFKKEKTAVTVITETKTDPPVVRSPDISAKTFEDSSLSAAQYQAKMAENNFPVPKNMKQLPPVNGGIFPENGVTNNMGSTLSPPVQMPAGTGEAYIYTIQQDDDANSLGKKFRRNWEQLKSQDYNYTDALPVAGKAIKIYGYIFFASESERERNENIDNALKSSPGLKQSDIIIVPGGILIP